MRSETDRPDRADRYEAAAVFIAGCCVVVGAFISGAALHNSFAPIGGHL